MKLGQRLRAMAFGLCLGLVPAASSSAADWRLAGQASMSLDKVYVDVDSISSQDGFKVTHLLLVSPEARPNAHGLVMDSLIKTMAFDCRNHKAVVIKTVGMLKGNQVGASPDTPDWQHNMKTLENDNTDQKIYGYVCADPTSQWPAPEQAGSAPPAQPGTMASGSGIFIDADGYVLTNLHVVNGCKTIAVKALRQPAVPGAVEAADPKNDLALIRIRDGYGAPMTFRSQDRPARLGENIMIMGYPLYGILSNEPKATFGQVNSVAGINNDYTLLQVSAPVQPGNSGGPVLDESGLVVGVVVSELSPQIVGRIGAIPQNVNFAIRGELAQIFMAAHGVPFAQEASGHRLRNDEIAARAEASTAQVFCLKP